MSVVLAVKDGEPYLRAAVESVLRQTARDFELVVVDDGSTDATPDILDGVGDLRLRVLRNDRSQGLASALNRGLDEARGRYVARLDADDLAFHDRLARQVSALRARPQLAVVGSAVIELRTDGSPGRTHVMPCGPVAVRWHALFSSPFFHPSVLLDRELLEREGLRYDTALAESEDYELWSRLLAVADGDNLPEPLLAYRLHPGQASQRRRDVQRELQREVALGQIRTVASGLSEDAADAAWHVGAGEPIPVRAEEGAAGAFLELLSAFERAQAPGADVGPVRAAAARALVRARGLSGLVDALRLDPTLPVSAPALRLRRRRRDRDARNRLQDLIEPVGEGAESPLRVAVVSPEPAPYRSPVFDRLSERPDLNLTVVYAGRTIAGRRWEVEPRHPHDVLKGRSVPGAERVFHHGYPVTPGIFRALARARPEVVVIAGWSTFPCQAAVAWCRARDVPYVLQVESHDEGPRAGWRRAVKGSIVPPIVRGAAGVLVTGTLVRESMLARGADPAAIRTFAVTIDVPAYEARADRLRERRDELRASFGLEPDDVAVLSVARLAPEKGLDALVEAVARAEDRRLVLLVAGEGPERRRLETIARSRRVRLFLLGNLSGDRVAEAYAAADVFALLSTYEPWGVVVNEAAASHLPLVLSDRVGAAPDLLRDGENGALVAAGDASGAAEALARLAADPNARRLAGERSRELVGGWGYESSIDGFVEAVRTAARRRP